MQVASSCAVYGTEALLIRGFSQHLLGIEQTSQQDFSTMNYPTAELKNWFDQGGQAYARFRPEYPPELAVYLASLVSDRALAVDVGCGNGQLSKLLATHFETVAGFDPSEDQIAHAAPQENVVYGCAPAEELPLPSHSANLITAAQAAHWFDLPRFYAEVRRVAAPDAILALVSYGVLRLGDELGARFEQFYWHEIGPYWPAERKLRGQRLLDPRLPLYRAAKLVDSHLSRVAPRRVPRLHLDLVGGAQRQRSRTRGSAASIRRRHRRAVGRSRDPAFAHLAHQHEDRATMSNPNP